MTCEDQVVGSFKEQEQEQEQDIEAGGQLKEECSCRKSQGHIRGAAVATLTVMIRGSPGQFLQEGGGDPGQGGDPDRGVGRL